MKNVIFQYQWLDLEVLDIFPKKLFIIKNIRYMLVRIIIDLDQL
jgi:hypothetical protein